MSDETMTQLSQPATSAPDVHAELIELRRIVAAAKFALPDALAARLRGETQQEIEADAAELAKIAKSLAGAPATRPAQPPANPANSGEIVSAPTLADQIRERIGGGVSPFFDPEFHKAKGGGPRVE
jgi:hypothetical protein